MHHKNCKKRHERGLYRCGEQIGPLSPMTIRSRGATEAWCSSQFAYFMYTPCSVVSLGKTYSRLVLHTHKVPSFHTGLKRYRQRWRGASALHSKTYIKPDPQQSDIDSETGNFLKPASLVSAVTRLACVANPIWRFKQCKGQGTTSSFAGTPWDQH